MQPQDEDSDMGKYNGAILVFGVLLIFIAMLLFGCTYEIRKNLINTRIAHAMIGEALARQQ